MIKSMNLFLLLTSASLLFSCAKEKPYDEVFKLDEVTGKAPIQKNQIILSESVAVKAGQHITKADGSREVVQADGTNNVAKKYLYVPMTLGTPREVVEADPFYQGKEKLVRLEWSPRGLEVIEMEKDERFSGNDLNDTPVLTIPGDFISYRCKTDDYGQCTNVEEEDTETPIPQRTHFRPKFDQLELKEVNDLDVYTISANSCVSLAETKAVKSEVSAGVINIELEKTYKLNNNINCLWNNYVEDKFTYNSFKVRYFYSIVALDQLASKDYQTVDYPTPDHGTFGFFQNERLVLDDNFDSQRLIKKNYLNRFNPQRKNNELVYHLSDTFNKKENKLIKKATYKAIKIINTGLTKAKVPFQIKLMEPSGKSPGDLRSNMIVLIDDPLANGLLGYGPSVSNPETGEIVKAHTNMYSGVLKSMTRRVWEAAADLSAEKQLKPAQVMNNVVTSPTAVDNLPQSMAILAAQATPSVTSNILEENFEQEVSHIAQLLNEQHQHATHRDAHFIDEKFVKEKMQSRLKRSHDFKLQELAKLENADMNDYSKKSLSEEARLQRYAKNNAYAVEFFPIGGTSKVIYPELMSISGVSKGGILKRWDELSKAQQEKARDLILERTYIATLIHELGHNLGLRHNFAGSFDKANFLSQEEATHLGLDAVPAYSSVMDYSFSEFNQLGAFGKYDVAALKFGYAREVELADGKSVKVNKPLFELEQQGLERKPYMFCTDENAGLSSTCNRFDEGTSLVEVAKFRIKKYKDAYKYRNFRDGRSNFSSHELYFYSIARDREFSQMRDILEEYEAFADIFGPELMAQGCSKELEAMYPDLCLMINDRRDSTRLIADFFLEVIKTPDHLCAIAHRDAPTTVIGYQKLAEIYEQIKYGISHVTTSCFDPAVEGHIATMDMNRDGAPDGLFVLGENGKFLNGFKDNDPNHPYSSDRAVRGVFIDKVLAMKYLFTRNWRSYSTDDSHMALVDIPYVFKKVVSLLNHLTMGSPLRETVPFTAKDGSQFISAYAIGNDYQANPLEDWMDGLKMKLGLPAKGHGNLIEAMLSQISKVGVDYGENYSEQAYTIYNFATVHQSLTTNNIEQGQNYVQVRDYYYSASDSNFIGKNLIDSIVAYEYLSKLNEVELKELVDKIQKREEVDLKFSTNLVIAYDRKILTQELSNYFKKKLTQLNEHQNQR